MTHGIQPPYEFKNGIGRSMVCWAIHGDVALVSGVVPNDAVVVRALKDCVPDCPACKNSSEMMWHAAAPCSPSVDEWLAEENRQLRKAGCKLAEAALHVAREYDGVHRLMLAVSEWATAVANEGGRGKANDRTLRRPPETPGGAQSKQSKNL